MLPYVLQCAMFKGACSGTDDDLVPPAKKASTQTQLHLKELKRLDKEQEGIKEALRKLKAEHAEASFAEKMTIEDQMVILTNSYKTNKARKLTIMNLYTQLEDTKSTLQLASMVKNTTDAQAQLVAKAEKDFGGKSADDIQRDQTAVSMKLGAFTDITNMVASPDEDRARRLGVPVSALVKSSGGGRHDIISDIDDILGISSGPSAPISLDALPVVPSVSPYGVPSRHPVGALHTD